MRGPGGLFRLELTPSLELERWSSGLTGARPRWCIYQSACKKAVQSPLDKAICGWETMRLKWHSAVFSKTPS